ncbi:MAG TPA: DUF4173 domain-containing protein [Gemmatimonadaceae bacterium]|nr:DUF4173 domain-containing protein [Gemmatimonadaceae bacterium]
MSNPQIQPAYRSPAALWAAGIAVAALGACILFDAMPGVNWVMWTFAAVVGLFAFVRSGFSAGSPVTWLSILAVVIAGGAAVTADEFLHVLSLASIILLLAVSMLLSVDPRVERIKASHVLLAAPVAFVLALAESLRRATDALQLVRSPRVRSIIRGVAITVPIVLVFGLLLASADPTFAFWRDTIRDLIADWAFIPRTIFFFGLLAIALGAFGYAERGVNAGTPSLALPPGSDRTSDGWLGSTERLILMGAVALLFWVFLAVQLSYLFGSLPTIVGSGMTFAEYARRGFGELSVVASFTAVIIILTERYGKKDERQGLLRAITLSVIVAVFLLLASAFHRVSLYEEAYGYTTARLYAQAYMIVVAISLVALVREVLTRLDPSRLFLRAWMTAALTFVVLLYWNHHAWIANRNIDLFASTGKLDTVYLTRDLSADAIPTIVRRLPALPEPAKSQLTQAVKLRNKRHYVDRWFEWNLGRARAAEALTRL